MRVRPGSDRGSTPSKLHPQHAGNRRNERPYRAHEPRHQDAFDIVAAEQVFTAVEQLLEDLHERGRVHRFGDVTLISGGGGPLPLFTLG